VTLFLAKGFEVATIENAITQMLSKPFLMSKGYNGTGTRQTYLGTRPLKIVASSSIVARVPGLFFIRCFVGNLSLPFTAYMLIEI